MRHAKTESWYQGTDDEGRALLPRGKRDAALVAAELKRRNWLPDQVLISSARRTRETWTAMMGHFPGAVHHVREDLYLAGTSALEEVIRGYESAEVLMLLGHNPGIHDLAHGISSRAGSVNQKAALTLAAKMPAGAVALFERNDPAGPDLDAFKLQDFIIAKKLRPEERELNKKPPSGE